MSEHICHAVKCETPVRPTLLMCRRHWNMVPNPLRWPVIRNYRRGQCDDKQPSREWIKAARAAISYVAAVEFPERCGDASDQLITCGLEEGHEGDHHALGWAIPDDTNRRAFEAPTEPHGDALGERKMP